MTSALAEVLEKLERAVSLVADMTPGELTVYDANEGDGWPPRPLWCFKNESYDSGDDPALQGSIHYGGKEDADAIVAAVNFLREHGPALLRDAGDGWLPIESAPHTGIAVLLWQPWKSGRDCTTIGHYANGWCDRFNEEMTPEPTHWRPLPLPPAMHAPGGAGGWVMAGKIAKRHDCGKHGMLTAKEIGLIAGLHEQSVHQRITRGVRGEALCERYDRSVARAKACETFRSGMPIDPNSSGVMFIAMRIASAFPHRAPTAEELMTKYGMHKATAYRWRRAWLDSMGVAA